MKNYEEWKLWRINFSLNSLSSITSLIHSNKYCNFHKLYTAIFFRNWREQRKGFRIPWLYRATKFCFLGNLFLEFGLVSCIWFLTVLFPVVFFFSFFPCVCGHSRRLSSWPSALLFIFFFFFEMHLVLWQKDCLCRGDQ